MQVQETKGQTAEKLTQLFIENWKKYHPQDIFVRREVGLKIIPPITESWIAAAFTKKEKRSEEDQQVLLLSDTLVKELKESDIYVIGTPMYNWSIPSGLKAYIDQVMRIYETWRFKSDKPSENYVGLLKNKKLFVLSSRGSSGYQEGEINAHTNFQTTYLKFIFSIMGVEDTEIISLDNEEFGGELFEQSKRKVHDKINHIR